MRINSGRSALPVSVSDRGTRAPSPAKPRIEEQPQQPADSFEAAPERDDELQRVGSGLSKTKPPPQQLWSDYAVDMSLARGVEQQGVTQPQLAANDAAAKALLESGGPLEPADLARAVRDAGVPLEQQDPNQLVAAARYVNGATDPSMQSERLYKTLSVFNVLDTIGAPKLTQAETAEVAKQALGLNPGALLDKKMADAGKRADALQQLALVANTGQGESKLKVGDYDVKLKIGADQQIEKVEAKKPGIWAKVGRIALTVASVVPSPIMPFAIAANAALSAGSAIKNKNWLGAAIGVAGAFVGGVGALGAKVASKGVQAAASVMEKVSKVAGGVQQTIAAVKAKSAGGLLGGLASAAAGAAGFVKNSTGAVATALNDTAAKLGRWSVAASAGDALRRGDVLGAAELGAGFAAGQATGQKTRGALELASASAGVLAGVRTGDLGRVVSSTVRARAAGESTFEKSQPAPLLAARQLGSNVAMLAPAPASNPLPAPLLEARSLSLGVVGAAPAVKGTSLKAPAVKAPAKPVTPKQPAPLRFTDSATVSAKPAESIDTLRARDTANIDAERKRVQTVIDRGSMGATVAHSAAAYLKALDSARVDVGTSKDKYDLEAAQLRLKTPSKNLAAFVQIETNMKRDVRELARLWLGGATKVAAAVAPPLAIGAAVVNAVGGGLLSQGTPAERLKVGAKTAAMDAAGLAGKGLGGAGVGAAATAAAKYVDDVTTKKPK